jgi:hypothetical protein
VLSAGTHPERPPPFRFHTTISHSTKRAQLLRRLVAVTSETGEMSNIDRRSALGIGLATATAAMMKPAAAQTAGYKDTTPWPGVAVREYDSETPSLIPGFKTVSMRDVIMQPGSKTMGPATM